MPRGGARPGAGRKKGSKTKATVEREARAAAAQAAGTAAGKLPLDIMLEAMRAEYTRGSMKDAFTYAKECAPYLHPKLSAMTAKVSVRRAEQMTTEELQDELKEMGVDVGTAAAVQGRTTH